MEGGERAAAAAAVVQSHRVGSGGGSEFFICFTSRPSSSSSMRMPSGKSLPSPGRGTAAPSLSASLSRRLKNSGSLKGGQSPATIPGAGGNRRKSFPIEAAEPSSPKVTCIGQVKVKTARMKKKKKSKATRSSSSKQGTLYLRRGGEAADVGESRACLPNRNQKWVHLPLSSVCEAVRSFGSEFNCFLPCGGGRRSDCSAATPGGGGGEKLEEDAAAGPRHGGEKSERVGGVWSCGAAFARWLMAVQESEEVKRGEMVELKAVEVMVGAVDRGELTMDGEKKERENATVVTPLRSPRNALLLMRCRSDPVKMAALTSRFWGSPTKVQVEDMEEARGDEEDEDGDKPVVEDEYSEGAVAVEKETLATAIVAETMVKDHSDAPLEAGNGGGEGQPQRHSVEARPELSNQSKEEEEEGVSKVEEEAPMEKAALPGRSRVWEEGPAQDAAGSKIGRSSNGGCLERESRRVSFSGGEKEGRRHSFSTEKDVRRMSSFREKEGRRRWSFSSEVTRRPPVQTTAEAEHVVKKMKKKKKKKKEGEGKDLGTGAGSFDQSTASVAAVAADDCEGGGPGERGEKGNELPDCLLLMMYEPKLSMEVSKETWVCSSDFLRHRPRHHQKQPKPEAAMAAAASGGGGANNLTSTTTDPVPQPSPPPPPSAPPAVDAHSSPAERTNTTEKKVAAPSYGPFGLTRCKSEPMRSSAKMEPDACFWKNRHRPIGAAGIGF
ncbi:unnamed protein product [Spirodela intermedia]|uniref:Uncharacterized protein n=1 Tax=Spirodela intermedia TaxID=51605 RepID=A0A7I8ISU9_SPIIN|nr:unnamed protein product [Spirodela intermedia]CAA6661083.1 unnamed protein product [Spirodela intermedia]